VVALGDMPRVRAESLRLITEALRAGAAVAAPYYGGRRGHPVGFARSWRTALETLEGDEGARGLLQKQGESIIRIYVDDPGCLLDVDTPDDLKKLDG
jgi:molybdenum cofactor cytidylyltransferase